MKLKTKNAVIATFAAALAVGGGAYYGANSNVKVVDLSKTLTSAEVRMIDEAIGDRSIGVIVEETFDETIYGEVLAGFLEELELEVVFVVTIDDNSFCKLSDQGVFCSELNEQDIAELLATEIK